MRYLQRESLIAQISSSPKSRVLSDIYCSDTFPLFHCKRAGMDVPQKFHVEYPMDAAAVKFKTDLPWSPLRLDLGAVWSWCVTSGGFDSGIKRFWSNQWDTVTWMVTSVAIWHPQRGYGIVPYKILLNIRNVSQNFIRGLTYFPRQIRGKYATRGYVFWGEAEKNIEIELNMTNV